MEKTRKKWEMETRYMYDFRQLDRDLVAGKIKAKLVHKDETGPLLWSIEVPNGFWMDSFKKKEDAIGFCELMGWELE